LRFIQKGNCFKPLRLLMIMPSPLNKINELIPYLPSKDITFAQKFVAKRDWEALKDLTWSSYQIVERAQQKEIPPAKYANLDLDKIRELALLCNEYYYLIYPEDLEPKDDNFNDVEEEF